MGYLLPLNQIHTFPLFFQLRMYIHIQGRIDRCMPQYLTDAFVISPIFNAPGRKGMAETVEIQQWNIIFFQELFVELDRKSVV